MRDLVKFTDIVQSIKNIYKLYKAIKELYPKMIIFMGYKTEEAFIKKYQGKAAKLPYLISVVVVILFTCFVSTMK